MFVLVGGGPGSGKTTLANALGPCLGLPVLAKDDVKEALADGLGRQGTVDLRRDEAELWGEPVHPLGIGPLVEVDTTGPLDVPLIAAEVLRAADRSSQRLDGRPEGIRSTGWNGSPAL